MIPYTAFATAVLGLLFIVLAGHVSRLRLRNNISLGDGGNNDLSRAIRAHANMAEFAPVFLLLTLALELRNGGGWLLGALVLTFVAGRIAHAVGLITRATSKARQFGALTSYLGVVIAALWLLITFI